MKFRASVALTVYTQVEVEAEDADDALVKLNGMDYGQDRYLQFVDAIEEA